VNESPSQAIEKEIEQESGFRARAVKLAALYDRSRHGHGESLHHGWKAFFLCEITGGEARGSYETDAVGFFLPDELRHVARPQHAAPGGTHAPALAQPRSADGLRLASVRSVLDVGRLLEAASALSDQRSFSV